jgi:hypothetical protein
MNANTEEIDLFLTRLRDSVATVPAQPAPTRPSTQGFVRPQQRIQDAQRVEVPGAEGSFASRLLRASGFGDDQNLVVATGLPGVHHLVGLLPNAVRLFRPAGTRSHFVLLAEFELDGRAFLADDSVASLFQKERRQHLLEDALDRVARDLLHAFARSDKAEEIPRAPAADTLCVLSIADTRGRKVTRNRLVHFSTQTDAVANNFESFTIEQECVDWNDEVRRDEYVRRVYERSFRWLNGPDWKLAFSREEERKRVRRLADAVLTAKGENEVRGAVESLFDEMAKNFGYTAPPKGKRVSCDPLPHDHDIGPASDDTGKPSPGLLVRSADDRLLGYVIYCLKGPAEARALFEHLKESNCFHNVLVFYQDPEKPTKGARRETPAEPTLSVDLWQGTTRMPGKLTQQGARFAGESEVLAFLGRFFRLGRNDIATSRELAEALARRAVFLRGLIDEGLKTDQAAHEKTGAEGKVLPLFDDFNRSLGRFPADKFASAYAETVTYGLLAARWLGKGRKQRFLHKDVAAQLPSTSTFLRALFARMVELPLGGRFKWLVADIVGLLDRTDVESVFGSDRKAGVQDDPVIHFYEDFLNAYDPQRRKREGVYYTPEPVVSSIVAFVDDILVRDMGLPDGLADTTTWDDFTARRGFTRPTLAKGDDAFVRVLDPAAGTGTFLKCIFQRIRETFLQRHADEPKEAVQTAWNMYVRRWLLPRLNGFELSVAPYIIAHLRLGFALQETGFTFEKDDRLHIYLTNTLELHDAFALVKDDQNLAVEGREADELKRQTPVTVIVGNPPYDRVASTDTAVGGWVVHGSEVPGRAPGKSLFEDIREIANANTKFSHVASLYNLYIYFWRWAVWKTLEANGAVPGVVGFITASSWLHGPGFMGLRKLARDLTDGLWTVDLGGDNKSAITETNIFEIETPVAVSILARRGVPRASARYLRLQGSVDERLSAIAAITSLDRATIATWMEPPMGPLDPLRPGTGDASWEDMPALIDLFPLQQPGCKYNRLWPIAPHRSVLQQRWSRFVSSTNEERPDLFVTPPTGRNIETAVPGLPKLAELKSGSPSRPIVRYAYRSFDRQWALDDPRVAALERPALWQSLSKKQVFLTGLLTKPVGDGSVLNATTCIPDLDYFCGRGGKDIIPLYRDAAAREPNVTSGLLALLGKRLGITSPTPEDLAAYAYALLATPSYQRRFATELETPGLHVPLTADTALWSRVVAKGAWLLWLHTFAERYQHPTAGRGEKVPIVPAIHWEKAVETMPEKPSEVRYDEVREALIIGDGVLLGVRREVWEFSVSGMQVLGKWTGYRTRKGAGRAAGSTNPLDKIRLETWPQEWSDELRELVTVLTLTLDQEPEQAALLEEVCAGPLIPASKLPQPSEIERKEPKNTRRFDEGTLL